MKRFSKISQILFTTLFVLSISLQGIQPAIAQGGDNVRISRNQHTGKVSFIGAAPGKPIRVQAAQMSGMAASDRALAMIQPYAADLGLTQPGRELMLETTDRSNSRQVSKFQQTYRDVPVLAGELVVNATDQGELLSINGEIAPDLNIDTKATITAAQAKQTALQSVAKWYEENAADFQATQPALWIYDSRLLEPDGSAPALVWRLEVTTKNAAAPVRELILVDADHGNISLHFNQNDTAWTSNQSIHLDDETPTDTPIVDEPTATDTPTDIRPAATDVPTETTVPPTETATELLITATSIPTETGVPTILPTSTPITRGVQAQSGISRYVATTGADSGDCTDPASPCLTINYAIGQIADGDTINVAAGTYIGVRSPAITLSKNVHILGGWDASFSMQNGQSTVDGHNAWIGISTSAIVDMSQIVVRNSNYGISNVGTLSLSRVALVNNHNGITNGGNVTIVNTTISGNHSNGTAGSAIYNGSGNVSIQYSTITENSGSYDYAIYSPSPAHVEIGNSILAGNSAGDCYGNITSDGHNIFGRLPACNNTIAVQPSDQVGVDPQLAFLTATSVHPLSSGSPAIGAADPVTCPLTDQLGVSRPYPADAGCDVGAYEYTPSGPAATISVADGSGQHAGPLNAFSKRLAAYVVDEDGKPVSGIAVTFTAPASGAGGTFADTGTNLTTAVTDSTGLATAALLTANAQVGDYIVLATAPDLPMSAEFALTNKAWFVSSDRPDDSGDCATPATACRTINAAIAKASSGDLVMVASGTYFGTGTDAVVTLSKVVTLSGGYNTAFTALDGETIIDGQGSRRGISIALQGSFTISRFVVQNGNAIGYGGGIEAGIGSTTLTLEDCVVRNSKASATASYLRAEVGAGIHGYKVTINNSLIASNNAVNLLNHEGIEGGGIYAYNLSLNNSTVTDNSIENLLNDSEDWVIPYGGGIFADTATISNSTISHNAVRSVSPHAFGGGIEVHSSATINNTTFFGNISKDSGGGLSGARIAINNSTIVDNEANYGGGIDAGDNLIVHNSILTHNIAHAESADCYKPSGFSRDAIGDHSLLGDVIMCGFNSGGNIGGDPLLLPASLGNPEYFPLLAGSPAIDSGNNSTCLPTDQGGFSRPRGAACDIGSSEYAGPGTTPAYIMPYRGAAYYPVIGSPAGAVLSAIVLDATGSAVPNVVVTFSAPALGASGTFGNGTNTITALTDDRGVAISDRFVTNATRGSYTVQASVNDLASVATFSLANGISEVRTYTMNHGTNAASLPGRLVCNLTQPNCTDGADRDPDHAELYAIGTYFFYQNHFHRDGLNGASMPIISSVHYGTGYLNAGWNGNQMVYGDGFPMAADVVAHELTHAVTQYTSDLFYYFQSGAINESLSDVFGELYDQSNATGTDTPAVRWSLGEDLWGVGATRSMSNPPAYGDPDKINSSLYYTGDLDNGGVHTNSGVNNKAAYLMVDGGAFNDKTVSALGADKTLDIYYEAQTHLLTSGSDYADLYDDLYQACLNLVGGPSGITGADCQSVHNAVDAVAMNARPASSPAYNPEAPVCATGQAPVDQFYDNFESGAGKWSFSTLKGTQRWRFDSPYGPFAHSGTHFLFADDLPTAIADVAAQIKTGVKIPANAYLHFAQAYDFEHYVNDAKRYDGGVVEYSADNGATWHDAGSLMIDNGYGGAIASGYGNPLSGRKGFVGTSHGYTSSRLNLSSLAGKTVKFRWRMGLDTVGYSWGWWLDDVRIYTCSAPGKISPPHGATNLKATVALSWRPVSGAKSYDYCYDTINANACSDWLKHGTSTTVSISGLSPSTKYYWQVRANTASGTIYVGTAWWSFTTGPLPAAFAKAGPANGAADQTLNPILSWNAAVGATGYEYCADAVDNNVCDDTWKPTAKTSASLAGLGVNSVNYWQVRAVNTFGPTEADAGAWSSFTTMPIVYTISGNAGAGGAALTYTDGGPVTALADGNGDYSLTVSPNWSGSVTPSKAGYIFLPSSLPYSNVTEDQTSQNFTARQLTNVSLQSAAAQDGWILESSENSSFGGLMDTGATTLRLGDDASRKQYRGILSFNTAGLPDNAVITSAILRLGRQAISGGGNPLTMFQGVFIDLRKGFFGSAATLQVPDFQAVASKSVGPFNPTPVGTLYSINLGSPAFPYINKLATNGGLTQLRLRFKLDDNNNTVANFISFYSGNYATAGLRPALVITYYLP